MLLMDSEQPAHSVLEIGSTRHNQFKTDAMANKPLFSKLNVVDRPTRMIEWQEQEIVNSNRLQGSKLREVTSKIGQ